MDDLEKVIKGLECLAGMNEMKSHPCDSCGYQECQTYAICIGEIARDSLSLLKAQELPDVKPEKLEERTTKWLDQMTAKERLEEIAAILDDWDGYRTAKGLAGLINEVWAYALYPVKEQESFQPFRSGDYHPDWCCGNCKYPGLYGRMKFCPECGKAVKWE